MCFCAAIHLHQKLLWLAKLFLTLRISDWDQQEYSQPQQTYTQPQQEYSQPQQEYTQPQATYDAWNDTATPANNGATGYGHLESSWGFWG